MEEIDLLEQIKRRLEALQSRIESRADPKLLAEVTSAVQLADVHLPSVFMQARRVLEIIVRDIYRRELPDAEVKPLVNMIEALYKQKRLIGSKIAADLHYIRANGNLIVHPQDEAIEIRPGDAEPVLFVFLGVVEWYLTVYLPERQGEAPKRLPALPPPPNPYRGLLAFRETDAAKWFGREPDAADLLAAIGRQPLVAVVGPSGSGKSSLVYAGVVPPLRATDGMRIADFRPRGRPFAALAQALVALWPIDPADRVAQARKLAAHLAEAQATLTDAVQETLRQSGGSRLVLIADQFEEIYTLGQPGDEPQGFADLLVQAVQDSLPIPNRAGPPELCLLLTLRADFLGHALAHPGLAALLDRCPPKLLGPVEDRARLRAIIEQPARGAGVALEDLLPERILRDLAQARFSRPAGTADQVGGASLPLLEFALSQLWDRQQERRLTHRGYEELGGIQQALSRHADGVLARLDPADQARMRHVLVQMVRPGEGTEDTRQVATRDQLNPDDWPLVVRLADADTRLVVTGHDQTTDQDTAELVHEALIRYWSPLREWINEDRAFRLWQNGLRQAMGEWERTGRDDGALLAGARLAEAEERIASDGGRISDAEVRYVQASVGRRDAEAAERERQRRERERLQRRISLGLAGFLGVALVLSGFAGWQWWLAKQRGVQLAASLAEEAAATDAAVQQRERADEQLLAASRNLARAHEEKAIGILNRPPEALDTRSFQQALLQALQAQRLPLRSAAGLGPVGFSALYKAPMQRAFEQRWIRQVAEQGVSVDAVAFSPDGRLIATGSSDRTVRIWAAETGDVLRLLGEHQDAITAVAFSADGKLLATASLDQTVNLWDVATWKVLQRLTGHDGWVNAVAFSPDGRFLSSASLDHTVRLWNATTGAALATLTGHRSDVSALAFSPDGSLLASASLDRTVRLWNPTSGMVMQTPAEHQSEVIGIAFSPDGLSLASAALDGSVSLWNPENMKLVRKLTGNHGAVSGLAFSPDGDLLAGASSDKTLRLWDPKTGTLLRTLNGHQGDVIAVAFSPDGSLLASTSADGTLRLWNPTTRASMRTLTVQGRQVVALAFSPDGHLLAIVSGEWSSGAHYFSDPTSIVQLWDPKSGKLLRSLGAQQVPSYVAFSPDGHLLATGSYRIFPGDNTVRLWNTTTGEAIRTLSGHQHGVTAVAFSPSGHLLASASSDQTIRLWDPATGKAVRTLTSKFAHFGALAFSPDGHVLATNAEDSSILLWDPHTGQMLVTLTGHKERVKSLAFSPDGRVLASASLDHTVRMWESTTWEVARTLTGHASVVNALAFSLNARLLATGSWDGDLTGGRENMIRLWNPTTGFMLHVLTGPKAAVNDVAFSPDGRLLASASDDKTVRLWDIRLTFLLRDLSAPSPRAALISEALAHLWGLRVDGLEIGEYSWHSDSPRQGYEIEQLIAVDVRTAAEAADPNTQPMMRTFDIRPLLDPPRADQDKLDQFLDWLADQERLEPRLAP